MPKAALLMIDLQNEVLHPDGTLAGDLSEIADGLLEAVRGLVGWARQHGLPVIWVRMAYRPDTSTHRGASGNRRRPWPGG